jgi:protein-disulfide isomerase
MTKSPPSARRLATSRRARRRRQRQIAVLLVIAGVAILVVGALILLSESGSVTAGEIRDYSSLPQGVGEDGAPYIGDPDAPVTLVEYSDFACPHCADFAETAHQLVDTYVADGSLRIVFKPMSFVNPQTSPIAAEASLCAADQGMFWEMHDALFGVVRTQGSNAFTQGNLIDLAEQIGLDEEDFGDCLRGGDNRAAVQAVLTEAETLGINSTPTVMFNGELLEPGAVPYDYLEGLILDALQ